MKKISLLIALTTLPLLGFSADFNQQVTDLIPRLADANVPARYNAQMELQVIASNSSKPGNAADRADLGKVLATKAGDESVPQPARVWIVRQLEYMGGAEAVETLTKLMSGQDAELRECARRALEKNSAPEASASLRAALEKATEVPWKIGLINSLGQRGDAASIQLLSQQLGNAPVAGAAAIALGRIGDPASVAALYHALEMNVPNAGDALISAAGKMAARGDAYAGNIYSRLYQQQPLPLRAAALSGLIQTQPANAAQLLEKVLSGNEVKLQQAALSAVARSTDKSISQALVALLPKLSTPVKAQAVGILETPSAEPQVIALVQDADDNMRRTAIDALGRLGTAAGVPVLLKAATEDGKPGKSNAEAALAKINGEGALPALRKSAGEGDAKARVIALNALAARKDTAALPAILDYASDADSGVKKAAFAAVRAMGADAELEPLAKLALKAKSPDAFTALEAVATRCKDKAGCTQKLLALAKADEETLASIMDSLSALGSAQGLATITKLSTSQNAETQDSAVRALGNWPDFAAVPKLVEIINNPASKPAYRTMALQGIVRLVKAADAESAQARFDAANSAMSATRSDDEKKLVLSAVATVPHAKAGDMVKPLLQNATLKAEAGFAAIGVAELLVATDKTAAKALAKDVKDANISRALSRRADNVLNK